MRVFFKFLHVYKSLFWTLGRFSSSEYDLWDQTAWPGKNWVTLGKLLHFWVSLLPSKSTNSSYLILLLFMRIKCVITCQELRRVPGTRYRHHWGELLSPQDRILTQYLISCLYFSSAYSFIAKKSCYILTILGFKNTFIGKNEGINEEHRIYK